MPVVVRQKPAQNCKAIILQLESKFKKLEKMEICKWHIFGDYKWAKTKLIPVTAT